MSEVKGLPLIMQLGKIELAYPVSQFPVQCFFVRTDTPEVTGKSLQMESREVLLKESLNSEISK